MHEKQYEGEHNNDVLVLKLCKHMGKIAAMVSNIKISVSVSNLNRL